ncbi:polysaccharide biosynthesis/export family protein [Simulacricoccus sp. 17bor-14]|nr:MULTISPECIES: polysaccharide export protein [Myxococcaceae]MBF5042760.1 polysaccharide biosynthesis/export family protein [Simulacricoccus sp. 17bor-14]
MKFLLGVLLLCSSCALGPGMRMDETALRERTQDEREGAEPNVTLVPITPAVLAQQLRERQQQLVPNPDPLGNLAATYEYHVAPRDVLSVTVWDHPELTIPAGEFRPAEATGHPVNADGSLFYPYVGVVQVAGKTLPELRTLLTERLGKVLQKPQLDVRVAAFRGYKVQVTGDVVAPSTLPITDVPMRALDALAQARGPTPEADLSNVVLSRDGKTYTLNLQATNEQGATSQNWLLKDGDILFVPDRSRNKIFVLGEVRRPSSRLMVKGRMSLAEAIGDTEGFDPVTSNPGKVYVIRGDFQRPTVYKLDASSADAMLLAVQFQLKPHDVVYVSAHNLTRWNRIISQLLPTVQLLWQSFDLTNRAGIIPTP